MPSRLDFINNGVDYHKENQEQDLVRKKFLADRKAEILKDFNTLYKNKLVLREEHEISVDDNNNVKQPGYIEKRQLKVKDPKNNPLSFGSIVSAIFWTYPHVSNIHITSKDFVVFCVLIPASEDD